MTSTTQQELCPLIWDEKNEEVLLIDQRLLPSKFEYVRIKTYEEMADAIRDMVLRGAPLIGIAAAFGMALAAKHKANLKDADEELRSTRPTAVNLMWALDEVQKTIETNSSDTYTAILNKAKWIQNDDIERCKKIGQVGAEYIKNKFKQELAEGHRLRIMTHCNAGALATGGYGTALGVIRALDEDRLIDTVYANETRPRQQGSRLTVWELAYENIPVTLITDGMAAHIMQQGKVDLVITGADRIAANGDAANKIGTYQVAIVAKHHNIPFFMAAPMSSFDKRLANGNLIPIEERRPEEVSHVNRRPCTLTKECKSHDMHDFGYVHFENPAFDVTPAELIEEIFTEEGCYLSSLKA